MVESTTLPSNILTRSRTNPSPCTDFTASARRASRSPASRAAALEAGEREARRAEAVKSVQGDGFVKDLVTIFDAKVVDSSIRANGREGGK